MQKPTKQELYAAAEKLREKNRKQVEYVKKSEERKKAAGLKKVYVWTELTPAEVRSAIAAAEEKMKKKSSEEGKNARVRKRAAQENTGVPETSQGQLYPETTGAGLPESGNLDTFDPCGAPGAGPESGRRKKTKKSNIKTFAGTGTATGTDTAADTAADTAETSTSTDADADAEAGAASGGLQSADDKRVNDERRKTGDRRKRERRKDHEAN